ncbi:hypothetical protein B0H14DRAFT_2761147 [Mycena olivaceomarginata]|nr:hypothetical protein B0H14DRAFT_2761147 [Mycena olivaceomarginata]
MENAVPPSAPTSDGSGSSETRQVGAFFSGAQQFVIAGGHFTSTMTNFAPTVPPDFPIIPLGHVDLRNEIQLDNKGAISRERGRPARRIYSARIHGGRSDMTVAVYEGANAEEAWKAELSKYSGLRHPNFVQLFGAVNSTGLYATIFHDDLIPVDRYLEEYQHSPISVVYLYAFFCGEIQNAEEYLPEPDYYIEQNSISWIRRSSHRLCVELSVGTYNSELIFLMPGPTSLPSIPICSLGRNEKASMISSLTLWQYHTISYHYLGKDDHWPITSQDKVRLGAIVLRSEDGGMAEISHLPDCPLIDLGWSVEGGAKVMGMDNGWTRVGSSGLGHELKRDFWHGTTSTAWLSQANLIFSKLPTTFNNKDLHLVGHIEYRIIFSFPPANIPEGHLFLCPLANLQSEDGASFRHPEWPAYWSLDRSGSPRLSTEEASTLGFPSFQLEMTVDTTSWDESVYAGLSEFHAGKGFDPNSRDIARHLGCPLYKLSGDVARIKEAVSDEFDEAVVAVDDDDDGEKRSQDGEANVEEVYSEQLNEAVILVQDETDKIGSLDGDDKTTTTQEAPTRTTDKPDSYRYSLFVNIPWILIGTLGMTLVFTWAYVRRDG